MNARTDVIATSTPLDRNVDTRGLVARLVTSPAFLVPAGLLLLIVLACVLAPILTPYSPLDQDLTQARSGPTAQHWLGTDALGRDTLARLLYGGATSLLGVAQATIVFVVVGVPLGLLAGYYSRTADKVISPVLEIVLSIPSVIVLLAVLTVVSRSMTAAMIAFGLLGSAALARIVRASTMGVSGELYVAAARVSGVTTASVIGRHVLSRLVGVVIVQTALFASVALIMQTGLSYLGLGVTPPSPSWGGSIAEAAQLVASNPWLLVPPGAIVAITIVCLSFSADAVRDTLAGLSSSGAGARPPRRRGPAPVPLTSSTVTDAVLAVRDLSIAFGHGTNQRDVVRDVSFEVGAGEVVGLVGESGSGKTITSLALLGLLPPSARVTSGSIRLGGVDIVGRREKDLARLRGARIAMVSQEPSTSLDPSFTIGSRLREVIRVHHPDLSPAQVRDRAAGLLDLVRISDPTAVLARYPHEISGGMAQRVAIASALSGDPDVLVADEPTTALDVRVQADILDLLRGLQRSTGMSIVLVTHNLSVVADFCDRVIVMQAGSIVEQADVFTLFERPAHPYTRELLDATPSLVALPGRA